MTEKTDEEKFGVDLLGNAKEITTLIRTMKHSAHVISDGEALEFVIQLMRAAYAIGGLHGSREISGRVSKAVDGIINNR